MSTGNWILRGDQAQGGGNGCEGGMKEKARGKSGRVGGKKPRRDEAVRLQGQGWHEGAEVLPMRLGCDCEVATIADV